MKIVHVADFEEAQLADDEIQELDARKQRKHAQESKKEALRRAKMRSFVFKGGML
jgi:hypothetical protein